MKSRSIAITIVAGVVLVAVFLVLLFNPTKTPEEPASVLVYANDFAAGSTVGPEWSATKTSKTPTGDRPYLGGFVEKPVELTLSALPKHKLLRLTFDLYLLRCWDGSSKAFGPKIWNLDVVGAQNLIHTTFSNAGFFRDNNEQAFPDTYPCRSFPAWTGAAEKQTLGVMQSFGGPDRTWDTSSVYHFVLTFPHTDEKVAFRFSSILKKSKDKSYGIANIKVETVTHLTKLSDTELSKLWKDLGGHEAIEAYAALWRLVSAGDQATGYIADHLKEPCDASTAEISEWVGMLDTEGSPAITKLIVQGRNSRDAILKAQSKATNPDTRSRLAFINKYITDYPETATELRNHRAKQLLQIIHSRDSLKLAGSIPGHEAPKIEDL